MSKEIQPHKGGRTERMAGRFTVEEKILIMEYMEYNGQSFSDAVVSLIEDTGFYTGKRHSPDVPEDPKEFLKTFHEAYDNVSEDGIVDNG